MGNRSNLLVKQNGQFVSLFEGNNTIALFWLMLVNEGELEAFADRIAKIFSEEDLAEDFDSTIVLDKEQALHEAGQQLERISQLSPQNAKLFNEWLSYLKKQVAEDGKIYLHISELAGFYESADKYVSFLSTLKASAEPVENYIQWLTGWDSLGTFRKNAMLYRSLEMIDEADVHEHRSKLSDFKFLTVLVIMAMLVGAIGIFLKISQVGVG